MSCRLRCLLAVFAVVLGMGSGLRLPIVGQALTVSKTQPAPSSHRLLWSEEFDGHAADPDPGTWTYETGDGGWGNAEMETYCSPWTTQAPCDPVRAPNSFVGDDGMLHLVARRTAGGEWTSARLVTHELQSFRYGRVEARIRIPRGQGLWPAFWLLGDDINQHPWPDCGEIDVMENIGKEPGTVHGSVHGVGFAGAVLTKPYSLPSGRVFADDFHVYGMLWEPGKVQFYVDDPAHSYATFTVADVPRGGVWPFDHRRFFLLLSLAVGGSWPGAPDAATPNFAEMLVDYVRVYGAAEDP